MKAKYIIVTGIAGICVGWILAAYWKKRWHKINAPYGKQFGYPECCIRAFCDQPPELLKMASTTETDKMRYDAAFVNGQYTGFIPCADHAKKILSGQCDLASLIKNRNPDLPPFPGVH